MIKFEVPILKSLELSYISAQEKSFRKWKKCKNFPEK